MTSRIQGWSNRQKDTGWGYAFAHLVPGVWIYYSITRRTITNFIHVFFGLKGIGIIVVALLESKYYVPSFFNKGNLNESTEIVLFLLSLILTPLVAKYAISEAREDGKKRLKKIKEEGVELKKIKGEMEQLKDELRKLKEEKK